MRDLLLTHGYFLFEDPKEQKIMKPYVPLGILYICSHLRKKGFAVDVFDSTFSSLEELTQALRTEKPSVLGVYANLMTRKRVVEIVRVAHEAGWKTIVGGPEPGAYVREYLEAGADIVVIGEGEVTIEELLPALKDKSCAALAGVKGIRLLTVAVETGANFAYFSILVQPDYPHSRDALFQKLRDNGIFGRRYFYPLISDFPMYRGMPSAAHANLPVARKVAEQVICLPIYPALEMSQVDKIAGIISAC